ERLDTLPARYRLLERSADLRERQRARLTRQCPHLQTIVEWLDAPPALAWDGVLVANEVVDALPVRLFTLREDGLFARGVALDAAGAPAWRDAPADAALRASVDAAVGPARLAALPRPYQSEVRPQQAPWLAAVTRTLRRGRALFIDYGWSSADYY